MEKYPELIEGMVVRSRDGERLGKVVLCNETDFQIEKGFFFPKDFIVKYDDILAVREGEVLVSLKKSELTPFKDESYLGWENHVAEEQFADEDLAERVVKMPGSEQEASRPEVKKKEVQLDKKDSDSKRWAG